MKKITLLVAVLLTSFYGFSQTTKPIDGFLGIKFGSTKAAVIAAMKAKGATLAQNDEPDLLLFNNVSLGHREASGFGVKFIDNKVYWATFLFKADSDPKTIEYYDALVSDLDENYGEGKQKKVFRESFSDGDGYELTALQTGDADYFTNWKSDAGSIQASINKELSVVLTYQDNKLRATADARQKAKEKSDF